MSKRATHQIRWTIEEGEGPRADLRCFAGEDATCRTTCFGCEEGWSRGDEDGTCSEGHMLAFGEQCLAVEWIGMEATVGEGYGGDHHEVRSGAITVEWSDYEQQWTWRYVR